MLNKLAVSFHANVKSGTKTEMRSIYIPILHTNFTLFSEVVLVVA